jgi:Type I restriction modification DNA specificity domain
MDDWKEHPLEHYLCRITYSFTNPMPTTDVGPYMVTARDVNHGRILYEQARRTSEDAFKNNLTDKCRPRLGDVLVTKDGTIGRIAVVDRWPICINQSVALLQPKTSIRARFLHYLLEAPDNFERMIAEADGSTIKHIYITRLAKMIVRVPPIRIQDAIVSVLGVLDDKIDLNRRSIQCASSKTVTTQPDDVFHALQDVHSPGSPRLPLRRTATGCGSMVASSAGAGTALCRQPRHLPLCRRGRRWRRRSGPPVVARHRCNSSGCRFLRRGFS